MSKLAEIRAHLLAQHAGLRNEIDAVRALCATTPVDRLRLGESLERLADQLHIHNDDEEDALRNVLPGLDVFGDVRKGVMIAAHHNEHQEIHQAVVAAGAADNADAPSIVLELVDRLAAHMDHEEDLFLAASVLGKGDAPAGHDS